MASIVSYRKIISPLTTIEIKLPEDPQTRARLGTELCTIDGVTYVAVPVGAALPVQPAGIDPQPVTLTVVLRDRIKAASPHIRLIDERVRAAISTRYAIEDEIKLVRTAPSAEFTAYNAYVEECRAWGHARKAELGL